MRRRAQPQRDAEREEKLLHVIHLQRKFWPVVAPNTATASVKHEVPLRMYGALFDDSSIPDVADGTAQP